MESLKGIKRNNMCGALGLNNIGEQVTVMGWVSTRRDLGSLIFIDLRDITGVVQIVFDAKECGSFFDKAESIRNEFVLAVTGEVVKRDQDTINPEIKTGHIEIRAKELRILSKAQTPPIYIEENSNVSEAIRLKYRYLDLRRPDMQRNLMLRHRVAKTVRDFLDDNGFMEIETPMLTKSTPEGARDYLVPSRMHPGKFYALPQSPQIFKQLLMVSGMDKYFQIVKCFRDEDLRADRQPEFTQIDIEMSFVDVDDIIDINEKLIKVVFQKAIGVELKTPFNRITYKQAMDKYGTDKPDVRFGLEIQNVSDIFEQSEFKVFKGAVSGGGSVRAINAKKCGDIFSRREIDSLGDLAKELGAKGLAWINVAQDGLKSPIAKFLSQNEIQSVLDRLDAEKGDLLLFVADKDKVVFNVLGQMRLELAKRLNLIDDDSYEFVWVTEFPLLEFDDDQNRYVAMHHPFTSPVEEDIDLLETDPSKVRAKAYDIVLNGIEIGGGSIRIHDTELQQMMFKALGFSEQKAWERFGFLMEAFKYGTPPHGGIAYGLDRLVMLLAKVKSIRDVIAFPKVQNASCPLTDAPSEVDQEQLNELNIKVMD